MRSVAAAVQDPEPVEHELKLAFPAPRAPLVLRWLATRCAPDPEHPANRVSSIYYDSRELELLRAKIESDFFKRKVRLRWYDEASEEATPASAFIEVKEKIGSRRHKARLPAAMTGREADAADLQGLRLRAVLDILRDAGLWVPADLQPFLHVRFRRHRFVEPTSGARVALDAGIEAVRANPALLPACGSARLAHAVVEVKGALEGLPRWLAPLRDMGCRREAFSKYARCYQKLARIPCL